MSNHLAVATVTAVLRRTLQTVLDTEVPGLNARVTAARPTAAASELPTTGVNLFLYQASPNTALRNSDLPTRQVDGNFIRRPTTALDLHYLLSFYGKDSRLEPQIVLACTLRALHTTPTLSPQAISDTLNDPTFAFLVGSDLADALEHVRFSPTAFPLEEMSKLWSTFFQTPYVLSVAFSAGPVMLQHEVSVRVALPVRTLPGVLALPMRKPVIDALLSQAGPNEPVVLAQPIRAGYSLVLRGDGFGVQYTAVQIDGTDVVPTTLKETAIALALPLTLRAGAHSVQVVARTPFKQGSPPVLREVAASNVVSFVLSPTLVAQTAPGSVIVQTVPSIGKSQRVRLILSSFQPPSGEPSRSFAFDAPSRNLPNAPEASAQIEVPISDVPSGTYLVRIQIDGAESPLDIDQATGCFVQPTVQIP
jgi:hypothetical protein